MRSRMARSDRLPLSARMVSGVADDDRDLSLRLGFPTSYGRPLTDEERQRVAEERVAAAERRRSG